MQHITAILALVFRPRFPARPLAEPLDHPCQIGAGNAAPNDLPLPSFALSGDGSVKLWEQ